MSHTPVRAFSFIHGVPEERQRASAGDGGSARQSGRRPASLRVLTALAVVGLLVAAPTSASALCYQHPLANVNVSTPYGELGSIWSQGYHRGVDYTGDPGTAIFAIADGTVVDSVWDGCQGNVVVVAHPDGLFSSYSHTENGSLVGVGTAVAKGTTIATVGTRGTCTTGPHVHLVLSDHATGYHSSPEVDPYAYIEANKVCSCDRSSGIFTFSCDGAQAGQSCVNVNEPADPSSWSDNFFCSTPDIGLKWSSEGKLAGLDCVAVEETVGPVPAAWKNNYLCVDEQLPYKLAFSMSGPLPGQNCVAWNEPAAASWQDNFLCYQPLYAFSAGSFTFKMDGAVPGASCVKVEEPGDPDSWVDNHFCSAEDIGMKWSYNQPIAGMVCTNVHEASDAYAAAWADNFL